jgi:hypothetical protein
MDSSALNFIVSLAHQTTPPFFSVVHRIMAPTSGQEEMTLFITMEGMGWIVPLTLPMIRSNIIASKTGAYLNQRMVASALILSDLETLVADG